jgi:hypothetical protein
VQEQLECLHLRQALQQLDFIHILSRIPEATRFGNLVQPFAFLGRVHMGIIEPDGPTVHPAKGLDGIQRIPILQSRKIHQARRELTKILFLQVIVLQC